MWKSLPDQSNAVKRSWNLQQWELSVFARIIIVIAYNHCAVVQSTQGPPLLLRTTSGQKKHANPYLFWGMFQQEKTNINSEDVQNATSLLKAIPVRADLKLKKNVSNTSDNKRQCYICLWVCVFVCLSVGLSFSPWNFNAMIHVVYSFSSRSQC